MEATIDNLCICGSFKPANLAVCYFCQAKFTGFNQEDIRQFIADRLQTEGFWLPGQEWK